MSSQTSGTVASLRLCPGHKQAMRDEPSLTFTAGHGIEGDRYAGLGAGHAARQVLLVDEQTLCELGLSAGDVRENVTTTEIALGSLGEGQRLGLGDEAVLEITRLCIPCARMDDIRPGLRQELEGRRGMLATVVSSGTVRVTDPIRVL